MRRRFTQRIKQALKARPPTLFRRKKGASHFFDLYQEVSDLLYHLKTEQVRTKKTDFVNQDRQVLTWAKNLKTHRKELKKLTDAVTALKPLVRAKKRSVKEFNVLLGRKERASVKVGEANRKFTEAKMAAGQVFEAQKLQREKAIEGLEEKRRRLLARPLDINQLREDLTRRTGPGWAKLLETVSQQMPEKSATWRGFKEKLDGLAKGVRATTLAEMDHLMQYIFKLFNENKYRQAEEIMSQVLHF